MPVEGENTSGILDLFEQVAGDTCEEVVETSQQEDSPKEKWVPPADLISYLTTLITPPDQKILYIEQVTDIDWEIVAQWADNSVAGLITRGLLADKQSKELLRVLKPGAYFLLIAPDEEPWGVTGACAIEDAGFEIRDAILVATPIHETSDRTCHDFHYTTKADRGERERGCDLLDSVSGAQAVDRKEGSAGLDNPRAGAGRTAKKVRNLHPTVKPVEIMVRLLQDIPKGPSSKEVDPSTKPSDVCDKHQVLDPFMGSGTTGLACMEMGYGFIGIDRESEYVDIATSRMLHWRGELGQKKYNTGALLGDDSVQYTILSEAKIKAAQATNTEPLDLLDLED